MTLGYIGLGRMGKNMVLRLVEQGHEVVVWNRSPEPVQEVEKAGAIPAQSVSELIEKLRNKTDTSPQLSGDNPSESSPDVLPSHEGRGIIVWLMLPAGEVTESMLMNEVLPYLQPNDIVIDGANSNWKDTTRRAEVLKQKSIHYIDSGVSGGPKGARNGACVMIGGDKATVNSLTSLWESISLPNGYGYCGKSGAGHFVKMVHNGIEYGMMQAIGEGFEVMKKAPFDLDLTEITRLYNTGSVIESRLVGWLYEGYQKEGENLEKISGSVAHSGEGQWTVEAAKELNVDVPIIEGSLQYRIRSTQKPSYTGKVVSLLRYMFGGHEVKN